MGGGSRDAEAVVGATADYPEDGIRGICEEELVTLLEKVDFEVGEEITYQACFTIHTKGSKPVTLRRLSHMQGEDHLVGIEGDRCGLFGDDEVLVHRFFAHPQPAVRGNDIH